MAPSSNRSRKLPQQTPGKNLNSGVNLTNVPELKDDLDSDYVIIENSQTEPEEPPLDHLTIYDGLLYEERGASTKPIAELQSQPRSGKISHNAPEPTLSSPSAAEQYKHLRNLLQISCQLETDIYPLSVVDMRNSAGDTGTDGVTTKILSRPNTSREVFGIIKETEASPHLVWEEPMENVNTCASSAILSEEFLNSDRCVFRVVLDPPEMVDVE